MIVVNNEMRFDGGPFYCYRCCWWRFINAVLRLSEILRIFCPTLVYFDTVVYKRGTGCLSWPVVRRLVMPGHVKSRENRSVQTASISFDKHNFDRPIFWCIVQGESFQPDYDISSFKQNTLNQYLSVGQIDTATARHPSNTHSVSLRTPPPPTSQEVIRQMPTY